MTERRAQVVSSFTIVKGSLIEETYAAFREWDFALSRRDNLRRMRETGILGTGSASWSVDVSKVLNRRFDPAERDRPLVELAKAGCDLDVWKPLLLWHLTRDEYLVRDFLVNWLFTQYREGVYRLRTDDVVTYFGTLSQTKGIEWSGSWTRATTSRVASGLLRMASDFGLLTGGTVKEFASYHLPEQSFMYLLYAASDAHGDARSVIGWSDWRTFLLAPGDVERELLRLHQFQKLHFDSAGSLAQLRLPHESAAAYVMEEML